MTPSIALELDHQGVRLLRRGDGGETGIGSVRLDAPDHAARIADLRRALGDDPPIHVEILLPPSLVLFLDVADLDAAAIEAAAEAETGCPADKLVIGRAGGVAAAVERTTLEEARDFARAHGFSPIAYTVRRDHDAGRSIRFRLEPLPAPAVRSHGATGAEAPKPKGAAAVPTRAARRAAPVATAPRIAPARSEAEAFTVFGARDRVPESRLVTPLRAAAAFLATAALFVIFGLPGSDSGRPQLVGVEHPAPGPADLATEATPVATAGVELAAVGLDGDASAGASLDPLAEAGILPAPEPQTVATAAPDSTGPTADMENEAVVWEAPRSDLSTTVALPQPTPVQDAATTAAPPLPPAEPEVAALAQPPTPPPAPGTVFDMDERGLVRPSEEGALTPQGVLVHAGPPAPLPPEAVFGGGASESAEVRSAVAETQDDAALAQPEEAATSLQPDIPDVRPELRPESEPAVPVTVLVANDDTVRPRDRPEAVEEVAVASLGPAGAPDFDALAQQARSPTAAAGAGIAATAPRAAQPPPEEPVGRANVAVQPSLPTRAAVAERATIANAVRLNRVNLIGVYGSASDRRALIRLPSGRYLKIKVGDRLDGGRVAAIQSSSVEYVKDGQRYALTMPNG